MDRLDKPSSSKKLAHMTFQAEKTSGNIVLTVEDAAIGYHNQILSEPIDLEVNKLDAIAVVGPNGIGKSTLIKSITKEIPLLKGHLKYGANVEIGYYDQTQSHLSPSNSVLEEIWKDFPTTAEVDIRNRLGAFLFSGDDVKKSVAMLSGGEKARLLLAKLSMENNNFLVLDEPTNHLDIDSKEVLENALIAFDGTILFVSHDRYFINRIASKVLEISEEGSKLYLGDYDYYVTKKAELEELARIKEQQEVVEDQSRSEGNTHYQDQKANQKEVRKLKRRYEEIETRLEEIDNELANIAAQMQTSNDSSQLMAWQKDLDLLNEQQNELMEEWEILAEQLEI